MSIRCAGGRTLGLLSFLLIAAIPASVPLAWSTPDGGPKEAFRELQLGYVALDQRDFESAIGHYTKARDLAIGDEQRFNALFGLGSAALELGRLDEARAVFEEAHELKPGEVGATYMLGLTCRHQGELGDAVTFLAEAAARDPDFTPALLELGIAYGALERHADAERVCRDVLAKEPESIDARLGLAVALFHQDHNEAAVIEFREVLDRDPGNLRAHFGHGLALVFTGDRDGAVEEILYLNSQAPELAAELHKWVFPDGN